MAKTIRVLQIEDSEDDALLVLRALRKDGYAPAATRVETESDLRAALENERWDVVLSDYAMPRFNGMEALEIVTQHAAAPPFILVSGAIGEERVVEFMRAGAGDVVMKNSLPRLAPAIERAMRDVEMRRERKKAEKALRRSEERFRAIADYTHDWEIWVAPEGGPIWMNSAVERITGYTREEYKTFGDKLSDRAERLFCREDRKRALATLEEGLRRRVSGNDIPFRIRRKDGDACWISMSYQPIYAIDGEYLGLRVSVRDITERKQAEEAARESEARMRTILNSIQTGIFIIDAHDRTIVDANPAAVKMLGTSRDKLIGTPCRQTICSDAKKGCPLAERGEWVNNSEAVLIDSSGETIPILKTISPITIGGREHILESCTDISERRKLEARLKQSHKMEAVGTLAGGIAHEFNNILSIVIGNAELAVDDTPDWSPARFSLTEIIEASMRARDIVRQLLSFSRKAEQEKAAVSIREIVTEAVRLLRASIPKSIRIHLAVPHDPGTILADPTQIHQVLINLCTNAAHAMENRRGDLGIGLEALDLDEKQAIRYQGLKPGRYARLSVRDNGCGIAPEIRERIFDPFFTTKESGKGTGMGLAVVHGIVTDHDGAIAIESAPGAGTTIHVLLPLVEARPEPKAPPSGDPPQGRESILFVDDEKAITSVAARILRPLGYRVESRTDPGEALDLFRSDPRRFDLVVTDMTMPGMTGDRLAEHILAVRHDMPIILCTGFNEKISPEIAAAAGIRKYIEKPLKKREMAKVVREVLDQESRVEAREDVPDIIQRFRIHP